MTQNSARFLNLLELAVASENQRAGEMTGRAKWVIWSALLAAIIFTASIYGFFRRQIIGPINGLTDSIREVQRQNFETMIPVRSTNEIGQVATAFNDMSAELRVMKAESDLAFTRLNRERSAIISSFPHPIFILKPNGDLSQKNPEAEKLMSAIEEVGTVPAKLRAKAETCIESGEDYLPDNIDQALLLRLDERECWYLPRIFKLLLDDRDQVDGWAVVLIDVTRVRWLDDVRSDLIGTVSHEIKTPLTSIRMILHLLGEQKTGELNETQEKMVGSARDECERLLETLEKLLDLSHAEGGYHSLETEVVQPSEIANTAEEIAKPLLMEKDLRLETSLQTNLPRVNVDPLQISQVVSNFLANAVKYSPENGVIRLELERENNRFVRLSVVDEGPGVDEADQDRIFERFYRAGDQDLDGTGMGLWISREIMRAHEGKIGVQSNPGKPTRFYADLPLSSH
ncbi:MAG: ATP-binding protein [Verrucomicrobiota bacterium]